MAWPIDFDDRRVNVGFAGVASRVGLESDCSTSFLSSKLITEEAPEGFMMEEAIEVCGDCCDGGVGADEGVEDCRESGDV